jgi:hypothetical protein
LQLKLPRAKNKEEQRIQVEIFASAIKRYKGGCQDVSNEGRAKVLKVGKAPKDSATAEWYEPDPVTGTMAHKQLDNGEVWHLDKRACYTLPKGTT